MNFLKNSSAFENYNGTEKLLISGPFLLFDPAFRQLPNIKDSEQASSCPHSVKLLFVSAEWYLLLLLFERDRPIPLYFHKKRLFAGFPALHHGRSRRAYTACSVIPRGRGCFMLLSLLIHSSKHKKQWTLRRKRKYPRRLLMTSTGVLSRPCISPSLSGFTMCLLNRPYPVLY